MTDEVHVDYKRAYSSIETELYDDFIVDKAPPKRTRIIDEYHLQDILRDSNDESQDDRPLSKDVSATGSKSQLPESTQRSALK